MDMRSRLKTYEHGFQTTFFIEKIVNNFSRKLLLKLQNWGIIPPLKVFVSSYKSA
ncbi:hypothetical protein NEIMUCOT_03891 [Neisseria mucosa ATCC 25996]|uniref:Uncharacterized protein n=1 Tax=Neisseria mucosa (strain ATCC 25996 / DSM 4631 / NCTC 10774 / M26) TaxID=546266 RepID=D2ZTF5_NEIM2|nr:hypothetical protein NEIMUCOT_03891 [Neisseria mucosa ATCC 25996]